MATIDLNADLGEADTVRTSDAALLSAITSANVSCGFHAGTPEVIGWTVRSASERGVTVGAHVSYRDRPGFGRRSVSVAPAQLVADIVEQFHILERIAGANGGSVSYLKAHGALYHRMGKDEATAQAVVTAAGLVGCGVLVAPPGSLVIEVATAAGMQVAVEGFADRAYRPDGTLVPRGEPNGVLGDRGAIVAQALSLAVDGAVATSDGGRMGLRCDSLCIHSDTPGAAGAAAAVRAALERAGCTVRSFVPADRGRLGPSSAQGVEGCTPRDVRSG